MEQTNFDKTPPGDAELTKEQITALLKLAQSLLPGDPVRATTYAQQARTNAQRINDRKRLADSLQLTGIIFTQQARYDLALNHLLDAINLYEEIGIANAQTVTLVAIGDVYAACGLSIRALEYYGDALGTDDTNLLDDLYAKISRIYFEQGDYPRARDYARRRLDLVYEAQLGETEEADALHQLARVHLYENDFQSALQYARTSLGLAHHADTLITLGEIHLARGAISQAKSHFEEALKQENSVEALVGLAMTYLEEEDPSRAIHYLKRGLEMTSNSPPLHKMLAQAYRQQGDIEMALDHYEKALETDDDHLKRLQTVHSVEIARKDAQIYQLRQMMEQRETILRQDAEQRIGQMQQEIEQQVNNRDNVVRELNAFAHTVAHDLKAPLSLLLGFAGLLLDTTVDSALSEETRTSVEMMAKSAHRMNNIIDDLLLLAGVRDQEQVTIYPLNMANIIEEVEARLAYDISEKDTRIIKPERWYRALGYGPWIEAVWANYISNAIKYGGEPPVIEVGCTLREDGMIRFWVKDNGNGITDENQQKLFSEFMRLDQARARGHGLGLSIVKRIITRLGGEVGVESKAVPGQGSIFYFTLPAVNPMLDDD